MMIIDVILDANTEHEIFFLLTAYVESLRYCDKLGTLPQDLTRLPLSGVGDVQGKFVELRAEIGKPAAAGGRTHAILREAADVFGAAVDRLDRLAQTAEIPHERPASPAAQAAAAPAWWCASSDGSGMAPTSSGASSGR